MQPPRVLVVTVVHVPHDARILQRQIRALLDDGIDVTYAAPWDACGQVPPDGVTGLDLPRAVGRSRLSALRAARALLRRRAGDFDLVLLHDPELLLVAGAVPADVPVVWDVHEDVAASLVARPWVPGWVRPLARWFVRRVERRAERRHHLLLAEDAYQERFHRPHPVVPNAPLVPPAAPPPGTDRVVYLGRVAAARGARELVELGERLSPDVDVVVIGDAEGDVAEELRTADEAGRLRWLGFVSNREALEAVTGAMAGLSLLHDLPNFRGSMPTKVLEYMGCGVPVVTTPLPLAEEVVRAAGSGHVVPFGDVDAVVDAVLALRSDDARRVELGANGRRWVLEHHAWQAHGPRFAGLLRGWARPR